MRAAVDRTDKDANRREVYYLVSSNFFINVVRMRVGFILRNFS